MATHLDISDPSRIDELLADPANYVWRAVDCEYLDGWSTDFGLTGYDCPSLVRIGRMATSDRGASLTHRFWDTVDGRRDHRGERFIGVVIYAAANEPFHMSFRLGHQSLGTLEAHRLDNRRHLLVLDSPVTFIGEMEIFGMSVTGPGSHRVEAFVLLKNRPKPDRVLPRLLRVDFRTSDAGTEALVLTEVVAKVRIACAAGIVESPTAGRLHRIALPSTCKPGTALRITATDTVESAGESVEQEVILPAPPVPPALDRAPTSVDIELQSTPDHTGLPLRFGLPLSPGQAFPGDAALMDGSAAGAAACAAPLSVRADGSVRWMLIDTVCPASASDLRRVCLAPARQPDSPSALSVEQHDSALSVSNSRLRLHLDHESFRLTSAAGANIGGRWADCFSATLGNGLPLHARFRNWSITSRNTLRATVRVELEHRDAADIAHLRSTLWIDCFADQPFVLTRHRLEIISPMLAPACGGKVPDDPRFESARSAIAGGEHEQPTILTVQRFELRLPTALGDGLPWRVVVDHDLQHRAGPPGTLVPREGIPSGALSSGDAFVAVRDFWQNYPIGLSRDHSRLCVELLPELPDDYTIPGDEEAQICLGGWIRAGRYWLKSGLALSKDILIGFPSSERDSARWHAWLDNPPLVRATPSHTSAAGVTPPLSIKQTSPLPRYEKLADDALDSLLEDRARYRAFGQLNFGDWYGESGWSWGNNEYDQAFIGYMEFLRGGKPGWATLAAQATRHLTDVDTINHSSDPAQVGLQAMHMPGHLGGYYPPLFRSKIAGTIGLPSHTWVEGALLHWLLTGDPAVRETLDKTKRWLTAPRWFQAYEVPNAREAGWHIIHLCAFAAADNDPDPLQCAKVIVDRVLQRQAPGGGWEHNLLEAHCGCGYPRCRGEAGFMVGVLLASLKRYHALTADPAVAEAIVGGARWLIRRTFDHKTGYFRYTPCPNRGRAPNPQYTQWVLDGLADAYALSHDEEIGKILRHGLAAIGQIPQDVAHLGLGKALAQQMRYAPSLLATLPRDDLIS